MRNFLNTIIVGFAVVGLLILYSCNQLDSLAPQQEEEMPAFSIVDGRLVFRDTESYHKIYRELAENQELRYSWEQQNDFVSMFDAYKNITDEVQERISQAFIKDGSLAGYENVLSIVRDADGELEADRNIDNPITARLVNRNGILQVGGSVLKYMRNHVIKVENPTTRQVDLLKRANENSPVNFGTITKVTRMTEYTNASRAGVENCAQTYWSGGRRVTGELTYYFDGYDITGVLAETKHQKRSLGVWWAGKTHQLRLEVTGTVEWDVIFGTSVIDLPYDWPDPVNETSSSTGEILVSYCQGVCYLSDTDVSGIHGCVVCDNSNSDKFCYTNYTN